MKDLYIQAQEQYLEEIATLAEEISDKANNALSEGDVADLIPLILELQKLLIDESVASRVEDLMSNLIDNAYDALKGN